MTAPAGPDPGRAAELRAVVLASLAEVAPEADLAAIDPVKPFRDQLDLDSIDFLHFVMELDRRLHVEVPELDYPRVATLEGAVEYLAGHPSP